VGHDSNAGSSISRSSPLVQSRSAAGSSSPGACCAKVVKVGVQPNRQSPLAPSDLNSGYSVSRGREFRPNPFKVRKDQSRMALRRFDPSSGSTSSSFALMADLSHIGATVEHTLSQQDRVPPSYIRLRLRLISRFRRRKDLAGFSRSKPLTHRGAHWDADVGIQGSRSSGGEIGVYAFLRPPKVGCFTEVFAIKGPGNGRAGLMSIKRARLQFHADKGVICPQFSPYRFAFGNAFYLVDKLPSAIGHAVNLAGINCASAVDAYVHQKQCRTLKPLATGSGNSRVCFEFRIASFSFPGSHKLNGPSNGITSIVRHRISVRQRG